MGKAQYFGFNAPFVGGLQRVMSRQVDERLIKNDALQCILTVPGERVYRDSFGTQVRALVFEEITDAVLDAVADEIRTAITSNDDRVAVDAVDVSYDAARRLLSIRVAMSLTNQPLIKYILGVSLDGAGQVTNLG